MTEILARRGFLRGLVGLPLIGGGVTLLGNPTAAAVPVTKDLLWNYREWIHVELSALSLEMAIDDETQRYWHHHALRHRTDSPAGRFHRLDGPPPSTRAAVVLSAVGCDWREGF